MMNNILALANSLVSEPDWKATEQGHYHSEKLRVRLELHPEDCLKVIGTRYNRDTMRPIDHVLYEGPHLFSALLAIACEAVMRSMPSEEVEDAFERELPNYRRAKLNWDKDD